MYSCSRLLNLFRVGNLCPPRSYLALCIWVLVCCLSRYSSVTGIVLLSCVCLDLLVLLWLSQLVGAWWLVVVGWLVDWFVCLVFVCLFVCLFVSSFVQLFVLSFVCLFVCLFLFVLVCL